ncbi:MAG: hypothetical protein V2I33_24695, partial [Kangiellaceae bacterium]|nr:hypothetical protein [Kangiellaceae bacterium]
YSTQQQMKLDSNQRETIEQRKKEETDQAVAQIFGGSDSESVSDEDGTSEKPKVYEIFDEDEVEIPDVRSSDTKA